MTNTTPQAAEAARLAGGARVLAAKLFDGTTAGTTDIFAPLLVAIDRLRDLASRADSPVGEVVDTEQLTRERDAAISAHAAVQLAGFRFRDQVIALRKERARLRAGLEEVCIVLQTNTTAIVDTVWVSTGQPETLLDHCISLLGDPAVEAKPTAAEVTHAQPGAAEFNAHMAAAVLRQPGSASPSVAQKAVAHEDSTADDWNEAMEAAARETDHWQKIGRPDHKCGEYLSAVIRSMKRKPSAGAGVPQEVAMTDTRRLDWLLPNLHPANFGMNFEWDTDAEFLAGWRAQIDQAIKESR